MDLLETSRVCLKVTGTNMAIQQLQQLLNDVLSDKEEYPLLPLTVIRREGLWSMETEVVDIG